MFQKVLLLNFITAITTAQIESNYSNNNRASSLKSFSRSGLGAMGSNCRSLNFCRFIGKLKSNGSSYDRAIASSEIRKSRGEDTRIFPRSYYGGAPALYPAFDSISILASLAFLAFLLQSFAALFDRSRSIIPAVISSRDSSSENEPPDLPELILRALDEYFLNNDMDGNDEESSKKKSIKNRR